jgi:hypothetical protein
MARTAPIAWEASAEQTNPTIRLAVEDSAAGWSARIRADGCVDLVRWYNGDREDVEELHLCDLAATIVALERLDDLAREHFGPDWGR